MSVHGHEATAVFTEALFMIVEPPRHPSGDCFNRGTSTGSKQRLVCGYAHVHGGGAGGGGGAHAGLFCETVNLSEWRGYP